VSTAQSQRRAVRRREHKPAAQPAAAQSLEPLLRETEGKVKEERGLQRFGDGIGPEDSPVKPVELAGVLEAYQAKETRQKR